MGTLYLKVTTHTTFMIACEKIGGCFLKMRGVAGVSIVEVYSRRRLVERKERMMLAMEYTKVPMKINMYKNKNSGFLF
jgi:hypothetical protein